MMHPDEDVFDRKAMGGGGAGVQINQTVKNYAAPDTEVRSTERVNRDGSIDQLIEIVGQGLLVLAYHAAYRQVFLNCEGAEDMPPLGHQRQAAAAKFLRHDPCDALSVEGNRSPAGLVHSGYGL